MVNKRTATLVVAVVALLATTILLVREMYISGCVIQSAEDAIALAKPAMIEVYGEEEVRQCEPYIAKRDRWKRTWRVYGLTTELLLGGTPEAIIAEKDGQILFVTHGA